MWLMTRHGFYSIVQKDDGIHIRAREREDLERLLVGVEAMNMVAAGEGYRIIMVDARNPEPRILETLANDYRFRVIVHREQLEQVMLWLARTCDYPNFKDRVAQEPSQRRKPYHAIWELLARALRSYGKAPEREHPAVRDESPRTRAKGHRGKP